ncbi:MAG: LamG domain-containing protein, partial [Nitrospirota bacterium]
LLVYLPFEEVSDTGYYSFFEDGSINSNIALINGEFLNLVAGVTGNSVEFNSGSDSLYIPQIAGGTNEEEFTISFYVKPYAYPSNGEYLSLIKNSAGSTGTDSSFIFGFDSEHLIIVSNSNYPSERFLDYAIPLNSFTKLTLTSTSNRIKIYADGVLIANEFGYRLFRPELPVTIAGQLLSNFFNGSIDEFKIYKKLFTPEEICQNSGHYYTKDKSCHTGELTDTDNDLIYDIEDPDDDNDHCADVEDEAPLDSPIQGAVCNNPERNYTMSVNCAGSSDCYDITDEDFGYRTGSEGDINNLFDNDPNTSFGITSGEDEWVIGFKLPIKQDIGKIDIIIGYGEGEYQGYSPDERCHYITEAEVQILNGEYWETVGYINNETAEKNL